MSDAWTSSPRVQAVTMDSHIVASLVNRGGLGRGVSVVLGVAAADSLLWLGRVGE